MRNWREGFSARNSNPQISTAQMDGRGGKLERKNAELIDLKMAKTYYTYVYIYTCVL